MDSIIIKIKSNLKLLITIAISGIIIFSILIFLNKKNQNFELSLSEKFYDASILIDKKKNKEATIILENIIEKRNKLYSPLSLFLIIEKNLISNDKKILALFDEVLQIKKIDKENLNLIKIKKAFFIMKLDNEIELISLLNPIINSESIWKKEAITLLGDYFLSKNEEVKANNYYKLLKIKKNN
tara:strand:- start:9388 stop:9939 length:552 start_codon:yes stop_codon:yes gene_type:complete